MHAITRARALAAAHDIPTRIPGAIARRAFRPHQFHLEPRFDQPLAQIGANLAVVFTGRIERRDTDQLLRQGNQVVAARVDFSGQARGCILGHIELLVREILGCGNSGAMRLRW